MISEKDIDRDEFYFAVARLDPELFMKAALESTTNCYWAREVKKLVGDDWYVDAIKLCRKETGFGLKDSKRVIDAWRFDGIWNTRPGGLDGWERPDVVLGANERRALDANY